MVRIVGPIVEVLAGTAAGGGVAVETGRRTVKARLDSQVLFGKDSARLRPAAKDRIRQVAARIADRPGGVIRVVGYTDDLGTAAHGLDLSRRRARAVAAVLADQLPAGRYRIVAIGRGERDPAVPNTSESNRAKNRRVVITLTPQ